MTFLWGQKFQGAKRVSLFWEVSLFGFASLALTIEPFSRRRPLQTLSDTTNLSTDFRKLKLTPFFKLLSFNFNPKFLKNNWKKSFLFDFRNLQSRWISWISLRWKSFLRRSTMSVRQGYRLGISEKRKKFENYTLKENFRLAMNLKMKTVSPSTEYHFLYFVFSRLSSKFKNIRFGG